MFDDFYITFELPCAWADLTYDAIDKKFDTDTFLDLFKKTFEVFRKYSNKETIDRHLVDLIRSASAFSDTRHLRINYEHMAACVLTEGMIQNCFMSDELPEKEITTGEWYPFLGSVEMTFDYTDPEGELEATAYSIEKWESMPVRE